MLAQELELDMVEEDHWLNSCLKLDFQMDILSDVGFD